ncbi:MAG: hypothetical protein ACW97O_15320 [Candidatus Thorarchaeota archaeon]|jgi:hypothetical protein
MRKIDDIFPNLGFVPALIIVIVLGIALQLSGVWMTMLIAGGFGGLFTRRHRHSFLAGFLGVGIAWTGIFAYLTATAQAMAVAEFFIGLLGSLVEIIDEFSSEAEQIPAPVQPTEEIVREE